VILPGIPSGYYSFGLRQATVLPPAASPTQPSPNALYTVNLAGSEMVPNTLVGARRRI